MDVSGTGILATFRRLSFVAMVGLLAACNTSTEGTKDAFADDQPAGTLYNEGLAYLNAGKLGDAVKSFDEVDRQHPYSEWARKALIMSAFASYRRGRLDDTVQSANRYLTLYPGSPDAAYARYLIGSSYFKQIPDVTRDQDATKRAMASLQEVIDRYPESEYATDAKSKIIVARDQLAGKEMQVGRYYLERREYIAAINRFKVVIADYQDTRHVEEALERLVEANLAMGLASEAQTAAAVLGHNFPDSTWYQDAYKLLQSGGLEPREDKGSWISQLFGVRT
ncbi:MAG: outer membrane protein assembly factor BamD [Bauldia sp.]|jgi:outer membrane protein assembly factor BamD|nr:outer membrane protein assembly factor BamD [Bauldia sp.]